MSPRKKKSKKPRSYLFEEVLSVLNHDPRKSFNYKQVAARLKITDHSQKLLINNILEELFKQDMLIETQRGKYKIKSPEVYITGTVDMTASGAAYVVSEESEEDIYIPANKTGQALQGDIVEVLLRPGRKGRKPEGEIKAIVERSKMDFVGIVQLSQKYGFLIPDSSKMLVDIFIPGNKLNGAKDGQKAIAKIVEWPEGEQNPVGEIIDVLGDPGNNNVEMHAILAEFGLPYSFPKEVEKEAEKLPKEISAGEIANRRDFRKITTFTIDPVDAKDFDDALSIQKLKNGNWEVGVHIADVSHYVQPGSILDQEALDRATSVYLVDRVVPMLPEVLSNNVCSLRPHEEKLCFSAVFEMDENATVVNEWFGRTVIYSDHRFNYDEVQQIIETEAADFKDEVMILNQLAHKLRAERYKKGSIDFNKIEVKFYLDDQGNPTGVYFKSQKDAHKLIEDFMLLANRKVAEYVGKKKQNSAKDKNTKRPFVYRVHDSPDAEKLATFSKFISRFGYKLNTKGQSVLAHSMNKLLQDVSGKKEENLIEQLAIRTMAKAFYATKNIGHYGLGFPFYTHFTSPIRRYPDVMVHRLLQYYLNEEQHIKNAMTVDLKELDEACKQSSDQEKKAADAERASIKYKQVQYLEDKIGKTFEGIISGVTEWGVYVELVENKCEGMVRIRDFKEDYFTFDEDNYCLRGRRTGKMYQLGDKISIVVKKANLAKKQLDFSLAEDEFYDFE